MGITPQWNAYRGITGDIAYPQETCHRREPAGAALCPAVVEGSHSAATQASGLMRVVPFIS